MTGSGAAIADAKTPADFLAAVDTLKAEHAASRPTESDSPLPTNGAPDPIEPEGDTDAAPERRSWKVIVNGSTLQAQTEISMDAIADANDPPFLFNRARSLVRVVFDENGNPLISVLNEAGVRGILERTAEYVKQRLDGSETPAFPPDAVVKDLMNLPEWNTIPPIAGIAEAPIVLPDGGLVLKQGYDRKTRLFYAPTPGLTIPPIPDHPVKADVDKAVATIREIFVDFPFVDDSSRANMIGALMTAVLRPMIQTVPMAIIDKPQAGTGATLLSEVIATVATGRAAALMTAPENDAEWRKAITASLSQGRNLAIVDNVETKLFTASLAAVLTSNTWTDSRFGKNDEMITLPHTMFWISTGNNLQLGGDLPRRCFWIRLDAMSARPWQRTNYRHPDLMPWVSRERGRILGAVLTIARGWILAGRPKPSAAVPRMGGFEGWRESIGGILEYCSIPGFLLNTEEMYAQADVDGPQWESFIEKWFTIWGVRPVTGAEIHAQMQREGDSINVAYGSDRLVDHLPDVLADALAGKKNFARVLGHSLSKMNGRKFLNGLTLRKGKDSHKVATWIVSQQDQATLTKRGVL